MRWLLLCVALGGCFLPELEPEPTAEELCNECVGSACVAQAGACDDSCQAQIGCLQACDPDDLACAGACNPGAEAIALGTCMSDNCAADCGFADGGGGA